LAAVDDDFFEIIILFIIIKRVSSRQRTHASSSSSSSDDDDDEGALEFSSTKRAIEILNIVNFYFCREREKKREKKMLNPKTLNLQTLLGEPRPLFSHHLQTYSFARARILSTTRRKE